MGKIIKRKIKKSFPWLVALSLLSFLFVGFSFNVNFDFNSNDSLGFINMSQEVQADTATTSVEVADAAPYFNVVADYPEEDPASASTSPVDVGGTIDFKGTGTDPENSGFSLVICTADSVSVSNWTPTCGGGGDQLCASASTTSGTEASCTYSSVTDPGSETQVWYGFVCDKNRCSASNQGGSTASGSPVYINHAPQLASVTTTDDNNNPGGTFTIQGSVTDSDTAGSADILSMYICDTDSFTVGGGCGGTEICNGTSTSPNVSCDYTDTAPTVDQAYDYYAFAYDNHSFQATATASSTYTINNVSPVIGSSTVILNSGQDINLNIKGASEILVSATSTSVTDQNGCTDLAGATSTIYLSGATNGASCSADDNDCYIISSCTLSDCSGASDATATYTCTTTFAFHTIPTDAGVGGGYAAMSWYTRIGVYDEAIGTSSSYTTLNGVEVVSTAALDTAEAEIDFGVVDSNGNTGATNASTTVVNYGNTPLDSDLYGRNLYKDDVQGAPDYIPYNEMEFATSTFTYSAGTDLPASTSPHTLNIDVARPTTTAVSVSDIIYWGIAIPLGTVSGDYYGQNSFIASEDTDGNWSNI